MVEQHSRAFEKGTRESLCSQFRSLLWPYFYFCNYDLQHTCVIVVIVLIFTAVRRLEDGGGPEVVRRGGGGGGRPFEVRYPPSVHAAN